MPTQRAERLMRRQQELLVRSAELRVTLAWQSRALVQPLAWADRLRHAARALREWSATHQLWWAVGLGALVIARPRRVWRWARRGWWTWRLLRRLTALSRVVLHGSATGG